MLVAIFTVFISNIEHALAFKETSYVKVSNLYKWWNCTF